MCGRFVLLTDLRVIAELFNVRDVALDCATGDNLSPGQQIAVILRREDQNHLVNFRWGLIPSWSRDPSIGNRMFNARAETIAEKPSFREAFQKRRCLIPADGFYEWQTIGRVKKPLRVSLKSGEPFAFAGLYETWISPERRPIHTCTMITTEPNELLRPIHDRMPVIVRKGWEAAWLDPANHDRKELLSMLKPYPSEGMTISPVDPGRLYRPKALEPAVFNP